jgi:hypothetical protein
VCVCGGLSPCGTSPFFLLSKCYIIVGVGKLDSKVLQLEFPLDLLAAQRKI